MEKRYLPGEIKADNGFECDTEWATCLIEDSGLATILLQPWQEEHQKIEAKPLLPTRKGSHSVTQGIIK